MLRKRRASGSLRTPRQRTRGSGWVMLCLLATGVVAVVGGCGSSEGTGSASAARPGASVAVASCVRLTAAQQLEAARVAFDGTMLAGPTVALGRVRVLTSPARMRVRRYLKGDGPRTVRVQTAASPGGSGVTVHEEGIEAQAGQRWRIYSTRLRQPLSTSICAGSRLLRAPGRTLRSFTGNGMSFAYPSAWHARRYQVASSFSSLIVYLSPQGMHAPCVTRHGTHNTTISCRQPITRLRPNSILAFWSISSTPNWSFKDAQGTPRRIGGRAAKLRVTHEGCGIAAQQTIHAVIPMPGSGDSWYELIACIRGPQTSARQHQVRDLLRSVRFDH